MTALAQPLLNERGLRRERRAKRIEFFRGAWKQWLSLNANNLVWTALAVGNVLLATVLTRG